jgi:hypothetical protein
VVLSSARQGTEEISDCPTGVRNGNGTTTKDKLDMGRLVWIASFPKSGNTWVRMLLANYLANQSTPVPLNAINHYTFGDNHAEHFEAVSPGQTFESMSDADLRHLTPAVQRFLSDQIKSRVLVKTHNANLVMDSVPLIDPGATAGAVYIVRNPLDIVPSYADHLGESIDYTISEMGNPKARTYREERLAGDYRSSWSNHVRSWCQTSAFPVFVLRYEALLAHTAPLFEKMCRFLKLPVEQERLERAVAFASFAELAEQEKREGFVERSRSSARFFREGKVGSGRNALSASHRARIIADHGPVMRSLGYLEGEASRSPRPGPAPPA